MLLKIPKITAQMPKILVVMTVLYLVWQISLSGAILDADTLDKSERLSNLAKNTVGFGVALFVFRAYWKRFKWRFLIPVAITCGFCAMWLEEATVDGIAARSTPEERLEAKSIQMFNKLLFDGKANIPMPAEIANNKIKSRAFLKVYNLYIWDNPELSAAMRERAKDMAMAEKGQEIYDQIDAGYERYYKEWNSKTKKYYDAIKNLKGLNFPSLANMLNEHLVTYGACGDNKPCMEKIQNGVSSYVSSLVKDVPVNISLEDFCRIENAGKQYVAGRVVGESFIKKCDTDEKRLYDYVFSKVDAFKSQSLPKDIPPEIAKKISEKFLSIDEWRELWKKHLDSEMSKQENQEFDKGAFAETGEKSVQGRNYAVSVFLPPVALGFSASVCFLHLASLLTMLLGHGAIIGIGTACVWAAPAIFAVKTPLDGFMGIYASWLVFWEEFLYNFGFLKWLM